VRAFRQQSWATISQVLPAEPLRRPRPVRNRSDDSRADRLRVDRYGVGHHFLFPAFTTGTADSSDLRRCPRSGPDHSPRHASGGNRGPAGAFFLLKALWRHVAPIRTGSAGGLFVRHGTDRHVRHGIYPDSKIAGATGILSLSKKSLAVTLI